MKKILLFLFAFCIPYSVFAEDFIPNAESGILMEANSGKIIYEKNIQEKVSVASMTKMVAQILILEAIEEGKIKWSDMVTVSSNASGMGGSQIYLETGEVMSVEDLMKGISVASGNDATVAMAEYLSGTEEKFVEAMNHKVEELGLKNTHFMNSTGLDEENHYSTAYDMAVIARDLILNHPDILRFSSIYEDYLREDTDRKFWLVNTNKLISQYEGTDGLKTGHTDQAGYCLAATVKRGDLRLIAIVLGEKESKVRNQETKELLDYGFQTVQLKVLKKKGDVIDTIFFDKADKESTVLVLKDNLCVVEDIADDVSYQYKIRRKKIRLPISSGEVVASLDAVANGKVMATSSLVVVDAVSPLSFLDLYQRSLYQLLFGVF